MSPVKKIAWRRIKQNYHKNILFIAALMLSMMMISFFSFFELQTVIVQNITYKDLPVTDFVITVRSCMNIAIAFLVVITFITVRVYCRMRSEEISQTLAVLTSIGAAGKHKGELILIELYVLYLPPTVIGVICGCIIGTDSGRNFQGVSQAETSYNGILALVAALLIVFGMLLIALSEFLPMRKFKKTSVIQSVKKHNIKASVEKHSYHQSNTYKSQILKRLAKKSVDYYYNTYNGIALTFATSVLYPILAFLLFWNIGDRDIVLDTNPYDGIDTITAALAVVDHLLMFLVGCFFVLMIVGIIQTVFMARMQYLNRKKSAHIYLSIGMPESDIRKMIFLELRSVLLRSFIYLLIGAFLANACFIIVIG